MTRSERKARRTSFRNEESALRVLVAELGPLPAAWLPEDEHDCLVHHLLSALHRGVDRDGLAQGARAHLLGHFGFAADESSRAAERIAEAAWTWWTSRPK